MTEETKKWIERLVTVAITAAVSGGGTYAVKQEQLDRIERMVIRLEGMSDACRGYEPAEASAAYRQGYRAQEQWQDYRSDAADAAEEKTP